MSEIQKPFWLNNDSVNRPIDMNYLFNLFNIEYANKLTEEEKRKIKENTIYTVQIYNNPNLPHHGSYTVKVRVDEEGKLRLVEIPIGVFKYGFYTPNMLKIGSDITKYVIDADKIDQSLNSIILSDEELEKRIYNMFNELSIDPNNKHYIQQLLAVKDNFLFKVIANALLKNWIEPSEIPDLLIPQESDVYNKLFYLLKSNGVGDNEIIAAIYNAIDGIDLTYNVDSSNMQNKITGIYNLNTDGNINIKVFEMTYANKKPYVEGSGIELTKTSVSNLKNNFDAFITIDVIREVLNWHEFGSYIKGYFELLSNHDDKHVLNYTMDTEGNAILEIIESPVNNAVFKKFNVKAGEFVKKGTEIAVLHKYKSTRIYKLKNRRPGYVRFTNAFLKQQGMNGLVKNDVLMAGSPVAFIYAEKSMQDVISESNDPWSDVVRGVRYIEAPTDGIIYFNHNLEEDGDIYLNASWDGTMGYVKDIFGTQHNLVYLHPDSEAEGGLRPLQANAVEDKDGNITTHPVRLIKLVDNMTQVEKGEPVIQLQFFDRTKPWLYYPLNLEYTLGTYFSNSSLDWNVYKTQPKSFVGNYISLQQLTNKELMTGYYKREYGVFRTEIMAWVYEILIKGLQINTTIDGKTDTYFVCSSSALPYLFINYGNEPSLLSANRKNNELLRKNFNTIMNYKVDGSIRGQISKNYGKEWLKREGIDYDNPNTVAQTIKNETFLNLYLSIKKKYEEEVINKNEDETADISVINDLTKLITTAHFIKIWTPDDTVITFLDENDEIIHIDVDDLIRDYRNLHEIIDVIQQIMVKVTQKVNDFIKDYKPLGLTAYETSISAWSVAVVALVVFAVVVATVTLPIALAAAAATFAVGYYGINAYLKKKGGNP